MAALSSPWQYELPYRDFSQRFDVGVLSGTRAAPRNRPRWVQDCWGCLAQAPMYTELAKRFLQKRNPAMLHQSALRPAWVRLLSLAQEMERIRVWRVDRRNLPQSVWSLAWHGAGPSFRTRWDRPAQPRSEGGHRDERHFPESTASSESCPGCEDRVRLHPG